MYTMKQSIVVLTLLSVSGAQWEKESPVLYNSWRLSFLEREAIFSLDQEDIALNDTIHESEMNKYFQDLVSEQMAEDPLGNATGKYFYANRDAIENSEEFKAIQDMPKGAALDVQDIGMGSVDVLWKIMAASPTLHAIPVAAAEAVPPVADAPAAVQEYIFRYVESPEVPDVSWIKISTLKDNVKIKEIKASLFVAPPPESEFFTNPDTMWAKYNKVYTNVKYIVTYHTTYESYIRESLRELAEDGVDYVEMKTALYQLHFNGSSIISSYEVAQVILSVVQALRARGTLVSCRLIYAPPRNVEDSKLAFYETVANQLDQIFGAFIVGYDLQGRETDEHPLSLSVPIFKRFRLRKFFFQAGDTNLEGSTVDDNLLDAIYMEASRLSGAYTLSKRPYALEIVKKKGITVSVNPIQHQLMGLCRNLRDHPVTSLIANDVKVVISPGAPGLYGARGVSHSYYYALAAFGGKNGGMRSLKRFVKRGLNNNQMPKDERAECTQKWKGKWASYGKIIWGRSLQRSSRG